MSLHGVLRTPAETMFGRGARAALAGAAAQFGTTALVCADPNVLPLPAATAMLRELAAAGVEAVVFDGTEPEVPLASVDRCLEAAAGRRIDVVIGFGGGSSIDMAKLAALLLRHPGPLQRYYGEAAVPGPVVPLIAVPTTSGTGSEVTPVAVVADPDRHLKVGVSSPHLIPRVAICDPELTLSCPPGVSAFSGIDALAHAVEAFTAGARPREWSEYPGEVFQGKNAFSDRFAIAAIAAIGGALEAAVAHGDDIEAREAMMYGSLCAGIAFGDAGTAGAHALQYPIGALSSTPHGLGVGLLLPFVLQYTRARCTPELAQVGEALGVGPDSEAAITEIARLAEAVGVPPTLAEIDIPLEALPGIASDAASVTRLVRNSARELDLPALRAILDAAWHGDRGAVLPESNAASPR
jgi:alcohol dehydrogenase class IV